MLKIRHALSICIAIVSFCSCEKKATSSLTELVSDPKPALELSVEEVYFQQERPFPPDTPHVFVYTHRIHNHGDQPVTLTGRFWKLVHEDGRVEELSGEGVHGTTPVIPPGGSHAHSGFHLIRNTASASGRYLLTTDGGSEMTLPIAEFTMSVPEVNRR
ncbi:MAG: ApaG domain [Candidatus Methylacidiphilales bacterium]